MVFLILRVMFMQGKRSSFADRLSMDVMAVVQHGFVSFTNHFVRFRSLPTHVVRCKFCRLPFPVMARELLDELSILGQEGAEVRLDAGAVRLDLLT